MTSAIFKYLQRIRSEEDDSEDDFWSKDDSAWIETSGNPKEQGLRNKAGSIA